MLASYYTLFRIDFDLWNPKSSVIKLNFDVYTFKCKMYVFPLNANI